MDQKRENILAVLSIYGNTRLAIQEAMSYAEVLLDPSAEGRERIDALKQLHKVLPDSSDFEIETRNTMVVTLESGFLGRHCSQCNTGELCYLLNHELIRFAQKVKDELFRLVNLGCERYSNVLEVMKGKE